jgi:membrane protein DedA with SNARE-associated domain
MDAGAATQFLGTWGYPAFVGLLIVTAFGSPLPEDLLLLAGGYLISVDVFSWPLAFPLAMVGVTGSDTLLYLAGRQIRQRSTLQGRVSRLVRPGRLRLAARWFGRFGDWAIFVSRLVPGTRTLVFVAAGMRRVHPLKFCLLDALGALVWITLLFMAGAFLGEHLGDLSNAIRLIRQSVIWIIVGLLLLVLLRIWWGREESKL